MKLRFLGEGLTPELGSGACTPRQPYSTSNNQIETIPSEHTARFLGRTYTLRRPIQKVNSQSCARKYRGVTYVA